MGKRLSDGLHRISRCWVALAALALFVLFMGFVLPGQSRQAETYAAAAGSPDTSLLYSPNDLYRMAAAYGPQGRAQYIRARYTFDVAWPLVYTLFLTTAISWIYARAFPPASRWQRANLTPLLALLLDFGENICASIVIFRYPAHTPGLDILAPAFTLAKWAFVSGSFVLLFGGAGVAIWRRLRHAQDAGSA